MRYGFKEYVTSILVNIIYICLYNYLNTSNLRLGTFRESYLGPCANDDDGTGLDDSSTGYENDDVIKVTV